MILRFLKPDIREVLQTAISNKQAVKTLTVRTILSNRHTQLSCVC